MRLNIRLWYLLVAVVAACAHGSPRVSPRSGETNVMRVDYVWPDVDTQPLNSWTWRASPWHCSHSLFTPSQVIVSGMHACVLDTPVVDTPLKNSNFHCPIRWVTPSNAC